MHDHAPNRLASGPFEFRRLKRALFAASFSTFAIFYGTPKKIVASEQGK